jgi:hypothetical protein
MKSPQKRTPAKKRKPKSVGTDDLVIDTGSSSLNIGPIDLSSTYTYPTSSSSTVYTTTVSPSIGNITINGTGSSYTYAQSSWNASSSATVKITGDGLDLDDTADIKIGDKSLKDFMFKMEERLALLTARPDLEEKWDKLRDLKKQYDDLVKDIEEKQKIMDLLKRD